MTNFYNNSGYRHSQENLSERMLSTVGIMTNQLNACRNFHTGFSKYSDAFMAPYLLASKYFFEAEQARPMSASPMEYFRSYMDLLAFNMDLFNSHFTGSMKAIGSYTNEEMQNVMNAWFNTFLNPEGEDIEAYVARQAKTINSVANVYPQAIRDIEPEFGFHFERGQDVKTDETDRFVLYQIYPTNSNVNIREDAKPILIIPPYVLGANILGFLPGENRSYAHCYANMAIPTYISEY